MADEGITKLDVVRFYAGVASRLLPWMKERPLAAERCPDGMRGECFFQKNFEHGLPPGVPTTPIRAASAGRTVHYVVGGHSYPKTSGAEVCTSCAAASGAHPGGRARARAGGGLRDVRARAAARHDRDVEDPSAGRVFADALRNAFGQTIVAPCSVRRRPRAPISTPLDWDEVDPTLDPAQFNLKTFDRRLAAQDPWAGFWSRRQTMPGAT